jgi:hypothetical protein
MLGSHRAKSHYREYLTRCPRAAEMRRRAATRRSNQPVRSADRTSSRTEVGPAVAAPGSSGPRPAVVVLPAPCRDPVRTSVEWVGDLWASADFPRFPQMELQSGPQTRPQSDSRSVRGRTAGRTPGRTAARTAGRTARRVGQRVGRTAGGAVDGRTAGGSAVGPAVRRPLDQRCDGERTARRTARRVGQRAGRPAGGAAGAATAAPLLHRLRPLGYVERGRFLDGPQDLARIPRVASRTTCRSTRRILPKSLPKRLPKSLPR